MKCSVVIMIIFAFNTLYISSEDCENIGGYACEGDERSYSEELDKGAFQTPPRNDILGRHRPEYQDMRYLVGYAKQKYSADKKSCTVTFYTRINPILGVEGTDYLIKYYFGGNEQNESSKTFNSEEHSYPNGLTVLAIIFNVKTEEEMVRLELEDEYFLWDNPKIELPDEYENGQRGSIVELFGWPYEDINQECEFLGNAGYLGVKIFSPNEQILTDELKEGSSLNPWWYGTQVVSFKFNSRYGNKKNLKAMINKCRSFNVRVYAETVINHLTGGGNDMYDDHVSESCDHWGPKTGSGGSPCWTISFRSGNNPITNERPEIEYPAIPYFPSDFHCSFDFSDTDFDGMTNGWPFGMADINTEKEYVQQRIADYYTELLSIGISGISIPNALYIKKESHAAILSILKENLGGVFPDDFIAIYIPENIVIEMTFCDEESELNFGKPFTQNLKDAGLSDDDIKKIKFFFQGFHAEEPKFLPICDFGDGDEWQIDVERQVISLEYSDDINMGNEYNTYIRDKNIESHRADAISLFTNERYEYDWKIRNIFSSFSIINEVAGIPDGKSDCSYCKSDACREGCVSFPYRKAYNPLSKGYDCGNADNWVEGEYTRIHRDPSIINAMRKWMFPPKPEMSEDDLYGKEKLKVDCEEKCLLCNDESKNENLCVTCNFEKGYYPVIYPGSDQTFYECYKSTLKYDRLYFDEKEKAFKSCYETCKECNEDGDPENHNCLSCDSNLVQKPGSTEDKFNCVTNCANSYYFTPSGQYKCTENIICPTQAIMYIEEKKKCIDKCQNDADFKYLYNGKCVMDCPENTIKDTVNYLCREQGTENDCSLNVKELEIDNIYNNDIIDSLVKSYKNEYFYTNKHTMKIANSGFNIYIYKNINCINMLNLGVITRILSHSSNSNIRNLDQNSCINKIKEEYSIEEDLIIVYFERLKVKTAGYLLYNPNTALKIDFERICSDEDIRTVDNFNYINLEIISGNEGEPKECPAGLYPIIKSDNTIDYKNCKNKTLTHENIYFDSMEQAFFPCYRACKTCNKGGDQANNNCLSCVDNYIRHPRSLKDEFNCILKCTNYYYFTSDGSYECTSTLQCPFDYNKFIKEKSECIDDCKKDDTFKLLYNGNCLRSCPEGTSAEPEKGDYICKEIKTDQCALSLKETDLENFNDKGGIDSLVKTYYEEFSYTNKHVSEYNNTRYKILIYKEKNCLNELNLLFPRINFGSCYEKVQVESGIYEDLIVVLLEKYNQNAPKTSSYSLYNPKNGVKLEAEEICKEETIEVEEDIASVLEDYKINYESILYLTDQNINVFDSSGAFYTDICYDFTSPTNRDITLEDRLKTFYPNVSLCDEGCTSRGVNLTTMKAICDCKFSDISNNDIIGDIKNIGGLGEVVEIISSSNIEVLKCIKYLFKKFKTSIGGYLIVFSLAICIGFGLLFYLRDLNIIQKYIISKSTSYLEFIDKQAAIPEDKKIEDNLIKNKIIVQEKNDSRNSKIKNDNINEKQEEKKEILSLNKINNSKELLSHSFRDNNSKNQMLDINDKKEENINKDNMNEKEKEKKKETEKEKGHDILEEKEDFKTYLKSEIDDHDFEEIVLADKRSFQEYFCDSLSEKQIFINTFYSHDPFRPRSIKIILLILNLILYMIVNALFYGEPAISEIYHIEGNDPFFGFFPRSITRFIYSAIVGVIIGLVVDCFFIEEKRMKKIFIREKDNYVNLKQEISKLNKTIKTRYLGFIILVIVLLILFMIYLLCFNYVYPHTQKEWIKSSITLIIIMQILSTLTALAETILRFISFTFKSERIFRVSKLID